MLEPDVPPRLAPGAKNPAYRPATEKALVTGLFLWARFAGDSSGSPRRGVTAVSVEPPGAVARRSLEGRAGYEPLRNLKANNSADPRQTRAERRGHRYGFGLARRRSEAAL